MGLLNHIKDKTVTIGVIGLGYVGLPLAIEFSSGGYKVLGIDNNVQKIEMLVRGESNIDKETDQKLKECYSDFEFCITSDFSKIHQCNVVIICVPTPLNENHEPDLSYILNALDNIGANLLKNSLIILESTTYPGTTDELLYGKIQEYGFEVGKDVFLCYSPERIDPGNKVSNIRDIPKIVSGVTHECLTYGKMLYNSIFHTVYPVSSTKTAEMTKLLENTFRNINIGFINEFSILCEKVGVNVWEVISAASTKPYGFMTFFPGPGVGGHCIPLDPIYLSWKAKQLNAPSNFIETSYQINRNMPSYVLNKIVVALNARKKSVNGSKLLLLGMAYKANIGDYRESPSLEIYGTLRKMGARVSVNEPHSNLLFDNLGNAIENFELNYNELHKFDCVIILTPHTVYQRELLVKNSKLIVDTRNFLDGYEDEKIFLMGSAKQEITTKNLVVSS
ncbi:nucleotide sugar dehydrogenase [Paenibacillus lautus]|uniref:nucleotide sugar dehydrogenase n=1 Tax=Paenibacillus lautus TaxID=1401 RepID=UPI003D2B75A7